MGDPVTGIVVSSLIGAGSAAHSASKARDQRRDAERAAKRQKELERGRMLSEQRTAADEAARRPSSRSANILARETLG